MKQHFEIQDNNIPKLKNKKWCYILVRDEQQPLGYRRFFVPSTACEWQDSDLMDCIDDLKRHRETQQIDGLPKHPSTFVFFHGDGESKSIIESIKIGLANTNDALKKALLYNKNDIIIIPHNKTDFIYAHESRMKKTAKSFANMLNAIMTKAGTDEIEFNTYSLGNHLMAETLTTEKEGAKNKNTKEIELKDIKHLTFAINSVPKSILINKPKYVADKLVDILMQNETRIKSGDMKINIQMKWDDGFFHGSFASFDFIERFYQKCPPDLLQKLPQIKIISEDVNRFDPQKFIEKAINDKKFADRFLNVCGKNEDFSKMLIAEISNPYYMGKWTSKTIDFIEKAHKYFQPLSEEEFKELEFDKQCESLQKMRFGTLLYTKSFQNFEADNELKNKIVKKALQDRTFKEKIKNIMMFNGNFASKVQDFVSESKPKYSKQIDKTLLQDYVNKCEQAIADRFALMETCESIYNIFSRKEREKIVPAIQQEQQMQQNLESDAHKKEQQEEYKKNENEKDMNMSKEVDFNNKESVSSVISNNESVTNLDVGNIKKMKNNETMKL